MRVRSVFARSTNLLIELTGAEAALVVNNNAGATLLGLGRFGQGSRSDCFARATGRNWRKLSLAGCDVTKRCRFTRSRDDQQDAHRRLCSGGLTKEPAALLRVHPSNYVIRGFTEQASLDELVELGHRHNLPVIDDIGSGALIDFAEFGLPGEPLAMDSVAAGADLVLFSGDKLLGGPQCGILVGRRKVHRSVDPASADTRAARRQNDAGSAGGDAATVPRSGPGQKSHSLTDVAKYVAGESGESSPAACTATAGMFRRADCGSGRRNDLSGWWIGADARTAHVVRCPRAGRRQRRSVGAAPPPGVVRRLWADSARSVAVRPARRLSRPRCAAAASRPSPRRSGCRRRDPASCQVACQRHNAGLRPARSIQPRSRRDAG